MEQPVILCPNNEVCEGKKVPGMGSDYCMNCGSWYKNGFGWNKLTIIDSLDECCICMNNCKRKLMFPTNCGHSFCINCSKEVLFDNDYKYCLSPVPYGCPPCPNGCENPVKGKQCNCVEYDSIQDEWEWINSEQFNKWNNEQEKSIKIGIDAIFCRNTCPLCKRVYSR